MIPAFFAGASIGSVLLQVGGTQGADSCRREQGNLRRRRIVGIDRLAVTGIACAVAVEILLTRVCVLRAGVAEIAHAVAVGSWVLG